MRAPCSFRLAIRCSSRSLLATIFMLGEPGRVEDLARLDAEVGEVAGVEADPDRPVPALAQAQRDRRGAAHALERVVGVDEEHAVVGLRPRPGLERLLLAVRTPSPSCGRAFPARAAPAAGRRGRWRWPRSRRRTRRARRERPPSMPWARRRPKSITSSPRGGEHDARRLGRDQRLEVDDVEQRRLDELRLQQRAPHAHQRLVGEDDRPLGHRVHVAGEAQRGQLAQERRVEQRTAVVAGLRARGSRGPPGRSGSPRAGRARATGRRRPRSRRRTGSCGRRGGTPPRSRPCRELR